MTDPFRLDESVEHSIQFSGGRSSGYMLRRILDAHGGELPPKVRVVFSNTGKEHPATLDFVHRVETEWGVDIHWVEYEHRKTPPPGEYKHHAKRVDYETASRDGTPFAQLIRVKKMLPSPTMRFCTINLKRQTAWRYLTREVGWLRWHAVVGFRADEGSRYIRALASERKKACEVYEGRAQLFPMVHAGTTKEEVMAYWASAGFDLRIPPHTGNCDLCFLKGRKKKLAILREDPGIADWWMEQERWVREEEPREMEKPEIRERFVKEHSVSELLEQAKGKVMSGEQLDLFPDAMDCQCTD